MSTNTAEERRKNIPIRGLHHHAFRTKDMEATRAFWEDLVGLPLVGTFVERVDPVTEEPSNYIHTFFEMADGSALAFFQFEEGYYRDSAIAGPQDPFDHHVALEVDSRDYVLGFKERAEAAGIPCMLIDHGYCYSVYLHDPNGMQVELTTKVPATEEIMTRHGATAHEDLRRWLDGLQEGNNAYRRMRDES